MKTQTRREERIRNNICFRCGFQSGSHNSCDGKRSIINHQNTSCTSCKEVNKVCFYKPLPSPQKHENFIGNVYKADQIADIAFLRTGKRGSHSVSWNQSHRGNNRAQFAKVLSIWEKRSGLPVELPLTTRYPNAVPLTDRDRNMNENTEEEKEVPNDRFKLPSSDLLEAIHSLGTKMLQTTPNVFGAIQPQVLLAFGILIQEIIEEKSSPETYRELSDNLVASKAPNVADVLGPLILNDSSYQQDLLDTLASQKRRLRTEDLFS